MNDSIRNYISSIVRYIENSKSRIDDLAGSEEDFRNTYPDLPGHKRDESADAQASLEEASARLQKAIDILEMI